MQTHPHRKGNIFSSRSYNKNMLAKTENEVRRAVVAVQRARHL